VYSGVRDTLLPTLPPLAAVERERERERESRRSPQHPPQLSTRSHPPPPSSKQPNRNREWPFEHLVPGLPRNAEPYNGGRQVGHRRREREREERQARVSDAMARMPSLIAAYRAARRVPWDEVTPVDRLLMTARQIREKYVLRKLK
jgi:hypothetical protein